jgi:hypothetical protein
MPATATRLLKSGTLLTTGSFDEVTFSNTSPVIKNTVSYSNAFNNGVGWSQQAATPIANSAISPDGTNTAFFLRESATLSNGHYVQATPIWQQGFQHTYSIYAKAGTRTHLFMLIGANAIPSQQNATFNLTTGAITDINTLNGTTATIVNVGNGWWRCSITTPAATSTRTSAIWASVHNGTTVNYTGDGVSGIYIWRAQVEQGTTATIYQDIAAANTLIAPTFKTTTSVDGVFSTGVFDEVTYNKTTPVIKNLLRYTETFNFDYINWTLNSGILVPNAIKAPDGISLAPKLSDSSFFGNQRIYAKPAVSNNTTYTFSLYLKPAERYIVRIYFEDTRIGGGGRVGQYLNLNTGTVILTYLTGTNTLLGSNLENVGNGWYRYSWTIQTILPSITDGDAYMIVGMGDASQNFNYQGDGVSGMYIWGAQMEVANAVTSYQGIGAINPITPLFAKREDRSGNMYVTQEYDEWTGVPITDGAVVYADAAVSASFTPGSTTWNNLANASANGSLTTASAGVATSNEVAYDSATMSIRLNDNRNFPTGQIRFPNIDWNALAASGNFTVMFAAKKEYHGLLGNFNGNSEFFQAVNNGYDIGWRITEDNQGTAGTPFTGTGYWGLSMSPAAAPAGWGLGVGDTAANRWNIVAFSVSPTTVYAFCNGNTSTRSNPGTYYGGVSPTNRGWINFTGAGAGSFNGKLGFFMAYNRALTITELTYNYNEVRHRYGL